MASKVEAEFNSLHFEKRLTNLKDSQESINSCCHWCLENRKHHKKIVCSWLNVLKRVKVEHRLTLFYLANDVIQYSKRRNFDFVESWGTTLQKATTMVRDEKIKHKILRIFKIWEQRGVYGEEFIADLCGLISVAPTVRKNDEPHEFQSSYLITKIRNCAKLESDTDSKLKKFKEVNPKKLDAESLCSSLKDRAHVDDVEKEVNEYIKYMESYVNALKVEIKARNHLISLLMQAETQLTSDKKDVKLVANAYKTFASRVKNLKKKLEELKPTLSSPIPSPDVNAPSPSPDSDIDLPVTESSAANTTPDYAQFTNAGFYKPVSSTESSFTNNGFSSFIGSNVPFDIQNMNSSLFANNQSSNTTGSSTQTTFSYSMNNAISSLFPSLSQSQPPLPPNAGSTSTPTPVAPVSSDYQYSPQPLLPPPLPPFTKSETYDPSMVYNESYNSSNGNSFGNTSYESVDNPYQPPNTTYQTPVTTYQSNTSTFEATYPTPVPVPNYPSAGASFNSPYPSSETSYQNSTRYRPNEEYNPEEDLETWDPETSWDQPPSELETPESPPIFEKEAYNAPIVYHDNQTHGTGIDVDHRMLPIIATPKKSAELDHRKKDVDHRNLISLTGSPKQNSPKAWNTQEDQDYRHLSNSKGSAIEDRDYRVPFNLEHLKLPPPPPPPNHSAIKALLSNKKQHCPSQKKLQDNVESIDMELSDDDNTDTTKIEDNSVNENLKVVPIVVENLSSELEPPPPFPELLEDDANMFLDNVSDDLDTSELSPSEQKESSIEDICNNSFDGSSPNQPPSLFANEQMWNSPRANSPGWVEQKFNKDFHHNMRNRGNGRGNFHHHRGPMEFRGRGRGVNWSPYRGGPMFRGSPRGPFRGFNRGMMPRGNRGFHPRGNFRGGF